MGVALDAQCTVVPCTTSGPCLNGGRVGFSRAVTATATATLLVTIGVAGVPDVAAAAAPATAAPRTHVYLVPHQDDEVLSMAATIRRSIREVGAANVHLVLMTTGQSSAARAALARGVHPRADMRMTVRTSLSTERFAQSRDAEFRASARRLGVPAANVHLSLPRWKRVADGNLTAATSAAFVNAAIDRFGRSAAYNTMSDVDPSRDHRTLGIQLRRIAASRKVAQTTYHYPQYHLPAKKSLVRIAPATNADRAAIRAAAREYGVVKPESNRWAVGWVSVAAAFGGEALRTWQIAPNGRVWKPAAVKAPARGLFDSLSSYIHR